MKKKKMRVEEESGEEELGNGGKMIGREWRG